MSQKEREIAEFCKRSNPDIWYSGDKEKFKDYLHNRTSPSEPVWISNTRKIMKNIKNKIDSGHLIKIQDKSTSLYFDCKKSAIKYMLDAYEKSIKGNSREYDY